MQLRLLAGHPVQATEIDVMRAGLQAGTMASRLIRVTGRVDHDIRSGDSVGYRHFAPRRDRRRWRAPSPGRGRPASARRPRRDSADRGRWRVPMVPGAPRIATRDSGPARTDRVGGTTAEILSQASERTSRRIASISSNCSVSAISGGESWITGSPRSSARQIRPRLKSAPERKPRSSCSDSSSLKLSLRLLVLDELDRLEEPGSADIADDRQIAQALEHRAELGLLGEHGPLMSSRSKMSRLAMGDRGGNGMAGEREAVNELACRS